MSEQIGKFYSSKATAMLMGLMYCNQEKQDVYLHQANIGPNQFEYSLRFRDEIINPESNNIIRNWRYTPQNQLGVVAKNTTKRTPVRSASIEDTNLPDGAQYHPLAPFNDATDLQTCPHCNGDKVEERTDGEGMEVCHLCEGQGEVFPEVYSDYRAEVKYDREANEA